MQVDALVAEGLISADATETFASNDLVIIVPAGNPAGITAPADLAKATKLATGNPETARPRHQGQGVPDGLGTWDALQPKFVFAENAAQTDDYVARGEVDAGLGLRERGHRQRRRQGRLHGARRRDQAGQVRGRPDQGDHAADARREVRRLPAHARGARRSSSPTASSRPPPSSHADRREAPMTALADIAFPLRLSLQVALLATVAVRGRRRCRSRTCWRRASSAARRCSTWPSRCRWCCRRS